MNGKNNVAALKILTASAMLAALSIVLGKYLAFNIGEVLRFSFENLPTLFAAYAFGPIVAITIAVVADLVGCLMVGYAINLPVTIGAALVGGISGAVFMLGKRLKLHPTLNIAVGVFLAHFIGSVLVKTSGLAAFYAMDYFSLMLWRLLNYAIIGALEGLILYLLSKNRYLMTLVGSFRGGVSSEKRKSEDSKDDL